MTLRPPLPSRAAEHHLDTDLHHHFPLTPPPSSCGKFAQGQGTFAGFVRPFTEYTCITTSSEPSSYNSNSHHEGEV